MLDYLPCYNPRPSRTAVDDRRTERGVPDHTFLEWALLNHRYTPAMGDHNRDCGRRNPKGYSGTTRGCAGSTGVARILGRLGPDFGLRCLLSNEIDEHGLRQI